MGTRIAGVLFAVISMLVAASVWSAPRYRVTDIGPGNLTGMNKLGTVLGFDDAGNGFRFDHGRKTAITVLQTPDSACGNFQGPPLPVLINDLGDVVLEFYSFPAECYALLHGGKLTVLTQGIKTLLSGINIRDQYVGYVDASGFLVGQGANCDLPFVFGSTYIPSDINDRGDIVGSRVDNSTSPYPRAALCPRSGGSWIDLGGLGGLYSQADATNELGQIVGYAATAGGEIHAFLYESKLMTDLGTLSNTAGSNSEATDINDEGQIVGWSQSDASHDPQPFVSFKHRLLSLQDSIDPKDRLLGHVTLEVGSIHIDDLGEIALQGVDSTTNEEHIYLLTPILF